MNKLLFDLDIRLPDKTDIFGMYKLEMFKTYGIEAETTDFANFLRKEDFLFSNSNNNTYQNSYFTKSTNIFHVYIVAPKGFRKEVDFDKEYIYARPVIKYSLISNQCSKSKVNSYGIREVEFGEYPQTAENIDVSSELEKLHSDGKLKATGKEYITNEPRFYHKFIEKKHIEYEYNGKKYIRFMNDAYFSKKIALSDGRIIEHDKPYFIKVEPIIWLIDEKRDIAVSKKSLFSGVQFSDEHYYEVFYNDSRIKWFLDNHFSKDIIPSNNKIKYYLVSSNNKNILAYKQDDILKELYTNIDLIPEDANYYPDNSLIYSEVNEITFKELKSYLLNTDKINYLKILRELSKYSNNKILYNKLSKEYMKEKMQNILSLKL